MRNVKCSDCDEYRNEWCEKVKDSPHPDLVRDCQYWHKQKDMDDLISRQWLIECVEEGWIKFDTQEDENRFVHLIRDIAPSAQTEIIRCNSCKYWTQTTGKMKGYGLGRCDFHDADLVACNGFCYWAERRTDATD